MVEIRMERTGESTVSERPYRITVAQVPFDAPWSWLAAGWRDMWTMPAISLGYGVLCAIVSAALTVGLMAGGLESLILALGGGFLLIGPLAAVGLYEVSRRLAAGEAVSIVDVVRTVRDAPGQLGFFGAILAFAYFVWLLLASLLLMLFLGTKPLPPANEFVPSLLFTPHGLGLLVTGTIVGGIIAALVFAVSAVSVPLLAVRRIDAVTAARTSLTAVAQNPKPMILWAGLIAGFAAIGIATIFVGLIIVFPLIGHATWHAFRDLVPTGTDGYL
jgi:uncharacterized membrane protein